MAARLAGLEKVTVALPGIFFVDDIVGIIIPVESNQQRLNMDAFTLFSIAFCFLSLADQARIHIFTLVSFRLPKFGQKSTRLGTRATVKNCLYSVLREKLA